MSWGKMLSVVDLKDENVVNTCFAPAVDVKTKQENEKCWRGI